MDVLGAEPMYSVLFSLGVKHQSITVVYETILHCHVKI